MRNRNKCIATKLSARHSSALVCIPASRLLSLIPCSAFQPCFPACLAGMHLIRNGPGTSELGSQWNGLCIGGKGTSPLIRVTKKVLGDSFAFLSP